MKEKVSRGIFRCHHLAYADHNFLPARHVGGTVRFVQGLGPGAVDFPFPYTCRPPDVSMRRSGAVRKYPPSQLALISFVGLRGAASIVFAIMILSSKAALTNDIFSIVFCIVLISIALQGSLVPAAAKVCKMTDSNADVMTTFSDFQKSPKCPSA